MFLLAKLSYLSLLTALRKTQPLEIEQSLSTQFRCGWTDIDFNMHLNNSRYLAFFDVGRLQYLHRIGALPLLLRQAFFPSLAFHAEALHRLAHRDPTCSPVAGGEAGANRPRMVDASADIGSRVDSRDHEIDRAEYPKSSEHGTHRRRGSHRPGIVNTVDVLNSNVGSHGVNDSERGTRAGIVPVGSGDHYVGERTKGSGQHVEAYCVNTVVVGHENSHGVTIGGAGCPPVVLTKFSLFRVRLRR